MNTLLLATHNKAKLKELLQGIRVFQQQGIRILSLTDLHITTEPTETGSTFEQNAKQKAAYYGNLTGYATISDDGGISIDALGGEPGIKSRRWPGYDATDKELIELTLKKLKNISLNKRTAYLQTSICFYNPSKHVFICEQEKVSGEIAFVPSKKRIDGYPYRSLFIVNKYNKYYDELTPKEHEDINHRLKAMKRLVEKCGSLLVK